MDSLTSQLESISDLASRIMALCEAAASLQKAPEITPEMQGKIAGQICLVCGKHESQKPHYRRGLCRACYADARRQIKEGKTTEVELMTKGMMAPEKAPGRKEQRTKFSLTLEERRAAERATKSAMKKAGRIVRGTERGTEG